PARSPADHGRRAPGTDAPDRPLRAERVQHLRSLRPRPGGRGGAGRHPRAVRAARRRRHARGPHARAGARLARGGGDAGGAGRLAPLRFHASVIAREIDASLAALYLPPGSPLSPARGKLDVSATIEQQAAAGLRVSLDAVFSDVELRRPGRQTAFLSAPAVRVTLENLRLRGGAVELERLAVDGGSALLEDGGLAPVRRWQAKGIALEARTLSSARDAPAGVATARAVVAGSPVSVWVANLR